MDTNLRLDWCSYQAAKYAVENWHYSKRMPVNKTVRIGVWENSKFIGSIVFSCGSAGASSIGLRLGLSNTEIAELSRVALKNHISPVTKIIKIALQLLKKTNVKLRLIVSYADPEQGHLGVVYQAGNWFYVGRSSPDVAYIDKKGRRWHSRSVSETGTKIHCGVRVKCPKPSEMVAIKVEPKYKYLYPLDNEIRKQIEPLRKPYPKKNNCGRGEINSSPQPNEEMAV